MSNGLYNGLDNGLHNGNYSGLETGLKNGLIENETKLKGIIKNGLVLHYDIPNKICYNGGINLNDLSVKPNNGNLLNGVGYRTNNGGVLYFDGINDYTSTVIPTLTTFSISLWVYSYNVTGTIFYVLGTNSSGCGIYFGGSAASGLFGYFDGTVSVNVFGNTALINTWNFITFTTTRILNGNYEHKIYIGNRLINNVNYTAAAFTINSINIGRRSDGNWYSNCLVPHLAIYNRALSCDEIDINYKANKNRYLG